LFFSLPRVFIIDIKEHFNMQRKDSVFFASLGGLLLLWQGCQSMPGGGSGVIPGSPRINMIQPGDGQLTVSWEPVQAAAAYEVWYGMTENSAQAKKTNEDIKAGTTAVIRGLTNDIPYYVWIKAKNRYRFSDFSPGQRETPAAVLTVPPPPRLSNIIAADGILSVFWEEAAGAASYELWYGTLEDPAAAERLKQDLREPRAVICGLNNDTLYHVWVRAKNSKGVSGFSAGGTGTPAAAAELPAPPRLAMVEPLDRSLKVSWYGTEGASSYEVYLGLLDNPTVADRLGDVRGQTTLTITGLSNNTRYYLWAKAKNRLGESDWSEEALSGRPSPINTMPGAPAILSVSPGEGSLRVEWQETEGAAFYQVWLGTMANSAFAQKSVEVSGKTNVLIAGLNSRTKYYVWISAGNRFGEGEWSASMTGTPQ
jgi:hypothetical protein